MQAVEMKETYAVDIKLTTRLVEAEMGICHQDIDDRKEIPD